MNVVDVWVVIIIVLLVLGIIFLRVVLPKILNRKVKKTKNSGCDCANCKHH